MRRVSRRHRSIADWSLSDVQVYALAAVPPEGMETIALGHGIPSLGTGHDAYTCGRCHHVVATSGHGAPADQDRIWIACPGCGWAVAAPRGCLHGASVAVL